MRLLDHVLLISFFIQYSSGYCWIDKKTGFYLRALFRTQSNVYKGELFCENSWRLKTKKPHHRCSTGLKIHLWCSSLWIEKFFVLKCSLCFQFANKKYIQIKTLFLLFCIKKRCFKFLFLLEKYANFWRWC